jgi:flagellar hook protein FlgE
MVAIYKSGMGAALQDIAVISNNIANAGTISFKRSDTIFEDIYATEKNRTSEIRLGNGVQKLEPRRAHQQGSFIMTNAALDLAINGEGFFAIKNPSNPDELKYTRNGSINLTNEGELVTMEGFKYLDREGNEIKIPFTVIDDKENVRRLSAISVAANGQIQVDYGQGVSINVATIGLSTFKDETKLRSDGNTNYIVTPESGAAINSAPQDSSTSTGTIQSGALEAANVDTTNELARLLRAQQAFSGTSRLMQADVDMIRRLID